MKLVVVGSVGLDDVETPFGSTQRALGGSAIYFAAAASFFTRPGLVGVVGADFPGEGIELLTTMGVDLRGMTVMPGATFAWGGRYGYDLNQRTTLFTHLNVFESFRPDLSDEYRAAELLFLGNIDPGLQLHVLDQMKGPSLVAMDTMNFWIEGRLDVLREVLRRVDILLINDAEARELARTANIVQAMGLIAAMGPRLVVVKRGEYGAVLYTEGRFFYAPAFPLDNVVDPTGAGDTFAGGFMGYLARANGYDWESLCRATIAGSTLASFCVEKFSVDRLRNLTRAEIAERARLFRKLTQFEELEPLEA